MREQRVVLEHEADVALVCRQISHVLPVEPDAAGVGFLEARDHAQRSRLAAAGRTQHRQEFAGPHIELHVARRVDLALHAMHIALGDVVDLETDRGDRHRAYPPRRLVMATAPGARKSLRSRPISAMTMNTITTTNTENAAAGPSESSVMFSRILTVISVQPIETRKIVALIAVIERMKTMPSPAKNAGRIKGSVILRNVLALPAPRPCDASSRLRSICCSSATVARMPVGP